MKPVTYWCSLLAVEAVGTVLFFSGLPHVDAEVAILFALFFFHAAVAHWFGYPGGCLNATARCLGTAPMSIG